MRRREFMTFLGGAAIASPIGALAQQTTNVPRVGILSDESPSVGAESFEPFAQGLRGLGWIEGRNIVFEHRSAERKNEILPSLAAELVRLEPNVILAIGTPSARAAKGATQTIPIVFARTTDPVGWGLVTSLARPGGNLTGLSVQLTELTGKRLELLITAVPDAKRVGVLWDPNFPPAVSQLKEVEGAARSLNLEIIPTEVRGPDDFEPALQAMGGAARGRSDRGARRTLCRKYPAVGRPDGQGSAPDDVLSEGVCRGGRPDVLRHELL